VQGPPGLDLSIVDCAELLDWLAGEVSADREPLVTVVADDQDRLVQIRTLYTPPDIREWRPPRPCSFD
jgi:hypothetical protein